MFLKLAYIPPTVDINLPGYTAEYTPTESSAGGTLIYISNELTYKNRGDLDIYKSKDEGINKTLRFD